MKKFIWFFFFLSILTYPIEKFRIYSIPIPLVILLFILIITKKIYNDKLGVLFIKFLGVFTILALIINILNNSTPSYVFSQFIYPASTILIYILLEKKYVAYSLSGYYLSSVFLLFYGIYGFVTWEVGDPVQHTQGYFGITYLNSTRNGDLVYLFPGLIISSYYLKEINNRVIKIIVVLLLIMFIVAIIANQSRGGFVVLLYVLFSRLRFKIKAIVQIIFAGVLIFFIAGIFISEIDPLIFEIAKARFVSIFVFNSNSELTYNSNDVRLELIISTLKIFFTHPWGVGITGIDRLTKSDFFHPENGFLSIITYYGLLGFLLFSGAISTVFKILKSSTLKRSYKSLFTILFISTMIYTLFNLMIDMLPFWIGLGLIAVLNKKDEFAKIENC